MLTGVRNFRAVKHDLGALELRADDEADSKRQKVEGVLLPRKGAVRLGPPQAPPVGLTGMGTGARGTWFYVLVGAVIGLARHPCQPGHRRSLRP